MSLNGIYKFFGIYWIERNMILSKTMFVDYRQIVH